MIPSEVVFVDRVENLRGAPWGPVVRPSSVAVLPDGTWFFADLGSGRVHRFDPEGLHAGELDERGPPVAPGDLAAHGLLLFVLDVNARQVLRYTADGVYRDVFLDLSGLVPRRNIEPSALAIDRDGRFAVADVANHQVLVTGPFLELESVVGEWGSFDGQFQEPRGVAFGRDGILYVGDRGNRRVQAFDRTGFFLVGSRSVDDPQPDLVAPTGITCDRWGNVFVADTGAGEVVVFTPDLLPALRVGSGDMGDGHLERPVDCAIGPDERLYVVDAGRGEVLVYELLYP